MAEGGDDFDDLIEDAEPAEIHGITSAQTLSNRGVSSPDIVPETAKEVEPATSRTNLYNRLGERSLDKGKCFDAAIVSASADDDLALKIVEDMNQLALADGTALVVKFWKDECFGANKVQRPRKIASKCGIVFILHTRNTTNDAVVGFTSNEAIAHICIHKRQDYIRSLCTDSSLEPLVGLEALDSVDWIEPVTEAKKQKVVEIITRHRNSDVEVPLAALSIQSSGDRCYKMTSDPRGLCVILNNVHFDHEQGDLDRHAAAGANERLKTLFENLKFVVWSHADKRAEEIKKIFEDAGKHMDDNVDIDCFVVFISSHGREGVIYSTDLKMICIKDIARQFRPDKCPTLKGKPKLFFIDACRKPNEIPISDNEPRGDIEALEDFFFCYAAQPGESSNRNNETGDVFTDEFIKVMTELSGSDHLADIMTEVTRRVKGRRVVNCNGQWQGQFPDVIPKLTKKVYFL
ncbi:caspase-3-like [Haliotis cracherodii]|uniref:caspase-3-like n=1 Tax=Haliotis cracherodii TaxID=6455 RepID=UPI0039E8456E